MKSTFVGLLLVVMLLLGGCSGLPLNPNPAVDKLTDIGAVLFLQNNPKYKADVVKGLSVVKVALAKEAITYQEVVNLLDVYISGKTEYGFIFYILLEDINTDVPIYKNPLSLEYRLSLIKRVDKLITLINTYVK
jgi:hypothetical protein